MTLEAALSTPPDQMAEALRLTLAEGADPNAPLEGRPPLVVAMDAIEEGAPLTLLDQLLAAGAHADGLDLAPGSPSPLLVALSRGLPESARRLLAAGASPCVRDEEGDTPLLLAVQMGDLSMARLLLEAGARRCLEVIGGPAGFTPLQAAVWRRDVEMARTLLEAGADPDHRPGRGASARDILEQAQLAPDHPLRALLGDG